ncbi:MAG: hypothetical protein HY268_05925 [Deltaproteobacteria bacterium]|nr:hypothetical protein [Deltaproteobacteria bacterium]
MRYVLFVTFSEPADAVLSKASADCYSIHRARMDKPHARGTLLMAGAFRDPQNPLSTMGIFTTREAAEDFARADPFVLSGLASRWEVREWNDVLAEQT